MLDHDATHFFLYQDCDLRIPSDVLVPKLGSLLLARHLPLQDGDVVLDLGTGAGLIATNPPQTPTPADREWDDAQSLTDNGGPDGWSILDRIIHQAPDYLKPQGRLVFTLFGFLGVQRAEEKLRAAGLQPRILAHEEQAFARIARERLE